MTRMTLKDLHDTMYTLTVSTDVEVNNIDGTKVLYSGTFRNLPHDLYMKARVYAFNPASNPMKFFVKED